ncbi:programmed cell death 1 ligand 1-like, partial [Poecilia reticulata]|uniref:programmed cell death 1 ligand 1-like n=1 Tax=Poecilia reticulata TaxID=8081 RepID=UPI0004A38095
MNLNFVRRDRTNPEMGSSSLTASLLLLSLVFMQFVSAADHNRLTIKAEPGDNLILPCKDPDQGLIIVVEWKRTDLESEYVLRYRDKQINPENQHPSYKNRADLLIGQMKVGDASLILRNAATDDSGTYECRIVQTGSEMKLISTVDLQVSPPP